MNVVVECYECQCCTDMEELNIGLDRDFDSIEDLEGYVEAEGIMFECPHCEAYIYVSDCNLM